MLKSILFGLSRITGLPVGVVFLICLALGGGYYTLIEPYPMSTIVIGAALWAIGFLFLWLGLGSEMWKRPNK